MPMGSSNIQSLRDSHYEYDGSNYTKNISTRSILKGSLGGGFNAEIGYNYSFTPLISAQLDMTFTSGKNISANESYYSANTSSNTYNASYDSYTWSSSFYQIAPLLRFDLGGEGKIHPYMAVGPVLGFVKLNEERNSKSESGTIETQTPSVSYNKRELKYTGSAPVGIKSVLGLEYTRGSLGFYAQATMVNMTFAPDKSEVTKALSINSNGEVTDNLPQYSVRNKITEYKKSYTTDGNAPYDSTKPDQKNTVYYSLSNIGLNLGVRYKF
jgi:hypothetical protein